MVTPRKHRHADMIRAWLDDASLEVEKYVTEPSPGWETALVPLWYEDSNYRFKPKMIKCGEHSFPDPMRVAPSINTIYWMPRITSATDFVFTQIWDDTVADNKWLKRGLCHTTKHAAEQHARALIALTESKS